ncbi:hypothetical protein ACVMDN_001198 [Bradyrhizobium sp. USDA 4510]
MFGNILVHLPTELPVRATVNGSISFAQITGAHLDAMAIGYERTIIPLAALGGAAVTSVFEIEQAHALERAEAALRIFDLRARSAGISYASRALSALPAEARRSICASARVHDMTIVTQPQSGYDSYDNVIPKEILSQAGKPVLYLPSVFHGALSARRVGICWDGSRPCGPRVARRDAAAARSRRADHHRDHFCPQDPGRKFHRALGTVSCTVRASCKGRVASSIQVGAPRTLVACRGRKPRPAGDGRIRPLSAARKAARGPLSRPASCKLRPGLDVTLKARIFDATCRWLRSERGQSPAEGGTGRPPI